MSVRHPARRTLALVTTAVVAAGLAACSSSSSKGTVGASGSVSPFVAAAQKDGHLTLYSSVEQGATQKTADAFTKKYGIKVDIIRLTSAQLTQRYSSEAKAGDENADFILISRTGFTKQGVDNGWFTPIDSAGIPGVPGAMPKKFDLPAEDTEVVAIQPAGIAYNTDLVKGDDVPKTWSDVMKPKWKGKVGIPDVSSSASYLGEWYSADKAAGGGVISGIGALKPKVYASGVPAAAAVASGEVAFSIMGLESHITDPADKGAPIKFVTPGATTGAEVAVALPAKSKHPNAAKLFAQWIVSQEGSETLSDAASAVSPYDTTKLPAQYLSPDIAAGTSEQSMILSVLQGK
jgi:iron(III) transport system substrate-binding protein